MLPNFSKKLFITLILSVILFGFVFSVLSVQAKGDCTCDTGRKKQSQWTLMFGVRDECYCCGDCNFCDFLSIVTQLAHLIIISVGGIALVLFIWGGIGLIFNWGNAESIKKNKSLLLQTFLAVIFVLVAWQLVGLIIAVLVEHGEPTSVAGILGQPWSTVKCQ